MSTPNNCDSYILSVNVRSGGKSRPRRVNPCQTALSGRHAHRAPRQPFACLILGRLLDYCGKGNCCSCHSFLRRFIHVWTLEWATIKHKKAATDAKRGKVFTKIIRELTIAAGTRGADPDTNPRLRTAILTAKGENMPNDNIERAIQRGTGTLEGETLDEVTFEGYGPGGVGVLVQVVTNDRNRIVSKSATCSPRTAATWLRPARSAGCSIARATSWCPRKPPTKTR